MKYNGQNYVKSLNEMLFLPHKEAAFHSIETIIAVRPTQKTYVFYNPSIEPGSPEFWGMVIKAGFVHWQYELRGIPATYIYHVRKNRKPRGKQLEQSSQATELNNSN